MSSIYDYIDKICEIPDFLNKYLKVDILVRLKEVGYFCGMDYASKNIYDFKYLISRYDHSLSTALLTWRYSSDKKQTIAALFHDISTPCFSHVIDYMNKDYATQESTEDKTEEIINTSKELKMLLKEDNLTIKDIINYKNCPIVDNHRPKLCADRLDGIILTSLAWTKKLELDEIDEILNSTQVYRNESNIKEIGFKNKKIANKIVKLNNYINKYCHSKEDNYMMNLLADVTSYCIENNKFTDDDLYIKTEKEILSIFTKIKDEDFQELYNKFNNIKLNEIPLIKLPYIKDRIINPLVKGERLQ
jgi:HD superfamily phosphohydrolase